MPLLISCAVLPPSPPSLKESGYQASLEQGWHSYNLRRHSLALHHFSEAAALDPDKAEPGSIRRDFGQDIMVNAAHASDSRRNAKREMAIIKVESDMLKPWIEKYCGTIERATEQPTVGSEPPAQEQES